MKREFGEQLILNFFRNSTQLTQVIDTSGAFLPGHGTPTVMLIGRSKYSTESSVRIVRSIRGEPSQPSDPSRGRVWTAIETQTDHPGSRSPWVSVDDVDRKRYLQRFPWILQDGGLELVEDIESASTTRLKTRIEVVGRTTVLSADDAWILPDYATAIRKREADSVREFVTGDSVRDYNIQRSYFARSPYTDASQSTPVDTDAKIVAHLWPHRTVLRRRVIFGKTLADQGRQWYEHLENYWDRLRNPLSITFPFVATHNHLALDRGGKLFNRHAPVIKLRAGSSEAEHLDLLGILGSSTACFWLKQVSHDKGSQSGTGGFMHDEWERFYEFTGTKVEQFPLPAEYPSGSARELDRLAQRLAGLNPLSIVAAGIPTRARLEAAHTDYEATRSQMIATQEELDWEVYRLYGLTDVSLNAPAPPELKLGERAFEIILARRVAQGDDETVWFSRHGSKAITELPAHWPDDYKALVERRIELIKSDRNIGLIERPENKRRWQTDGWDKMQERALVEWLANRCERRDLWYAIDEHGVEQPQPLTIEQLTMRLQTDDDVLAVAELYAPRQELVKVLEKLLDTEHVPFLAALRYKPSGLAKRADWEHIWDLQRAEDAEPNEPAKRAIRDKIPVSPKYTSADFTKTSYWQQRGKLDVPKERFISYAPAGRTGSPLLGWAGWDHREQAHALATLISEREQNDGWSREQLIPLLAGLREVMPWVRLWHKDFDPVWGASPAEIYGGFLTETAQRLHITDDELTGWRPAARGRASRNG